MLECLSVIQVLARRFYSTAFFPESHMKFESLKSMTTHSPAGFRCVKQKNAIHCAIDGSGRREEGVLQCGPSEQLVQCPY